MRKKVFHFLLFTLFAVNCMAFNLSVDTTKTNKKADNPLIKDGYDVDADMVIGHYGRPIQHLTSFMNNTITLSCPTPNRWRGFYTWEGFKISSLHVKTGRASFKGINAVILSPITMTISIDSIIDSIFTDRLPAIEYRGNRRVYSNVIRNTGADVMLGSEEITTGKEGIELNYEGGQGYKRDYQLLTNTSDGQSCLTNVYVEKHSPTARCQVTYQFDFMAFDDEGDFSLYHYRRHFPMLLRMGSYEALGE